MYEKRNMACMRNGMGTVCEKGIGDVWEKEQEMYGEWNGKGMWKGI